MMVALLTRRRAGRRAGSSTRWPDTLAVAPGRRRARYARRACRVRTPARGARAAARLRGAAMTRFLPPRARDRVDAGGRRLGELLPGQHCAGREYLDMLTGEQQFVALLADPAVGPRPGRPAGPGGRRGGPPVRRHRLPTRPTTGTGLLVAANERGLDRGPRRPARLLTARSATVAITQRRTLCWSAGRGPGHRRPVRYRDRRSPPAGRRPAPAGPPPRSGPPGAGGRRKDAFVPRTRLSRRRGRRRSARPARRRARCCSAAAPRPRTRSPTRAAARSCGRRSRPTAKGHIEAQAKLDNSKRRQTALTVRAAAGRAPAGRA